MSMISAQCDELRERAKELRNLAPDPDVPYLVPSTKETMALAMRSAAGEMEDAADTIWQLRDDLQRANAENAKLRELVRDMFDGMCDHDRCCICPHWQEGYNGCEYHARMRELGVEVDHAG